IARPLDMWRLLLPDHAPHLDQGPRAKAAAAVSPTADSQLASKKPQSNEGFVRRPDGEKFGIYAAPAAASRATLSSVSALRNAGNRYIHSSATATVPIPPSTTAGMVPKRAAVTPDSNSPS